MDTGDSKKKQEKKGKGEGRFRWAIQVFFLSVVLSAVLSLASEEALDGAGMALAFVVLGASLNFGDTGRCLRPLLLTLLGGCLLGIIGAAAARETGAIPFGPYLAAAGVLWRLPPSLDRPARPNSPRPAGEQSIQEETTDE